VIAQRIEVRPPERASPKAAASRATAQYSGIGRLRRARTGWRRNCGRHRSRNIFLARGAGSHWKWRGLRSSCAIEGLGCSRIGSRIACEQAPTRVAARSDRGRPGATGRPGSVLRSGGPLAAALGWPVLADGLNPLRNHATANPPMGGQVTTRSCVQLRCAARLKPEVVFGLGRLAHQQAIAPVAAGRGCGNVDRRGRQPEP